MSKRTPSSRNSPLFDALLIVLLVAVPLVWSSQFVFVTYYPKLVALQIGVLLLCLAWFFQKPNRNHFCTSSLTLPIAAYVLVSALSITQALNRFEVILQLSHLIAFPLFFWVVLNNFRSQNLSRYFAYAVGTGIVIAIIGIIQYAGWGLHWIPSAGFPSGTLGYRNYAAMYTILCIPLSLYLFIESLQEKQRYLWGLGTTLLMTFLICTRTRGAWLGLSIAVVLGIVILFFLKTHDGNPLWKALHNSFTPQHLPPAIAGLIICITFFLLVPPNMEGRGFDRNRPDKASILSNVTSIVDRSQDTRKSVEDRLDMWENSVAMIEKHPLIGVGLGNWQYQYPPYDNGKVIWEGGTPKRPHNDYIWIASEQGILGLLMYLWLIITALVMIIHLIRTQNRSRVALPFFIGLSLIAILTHAMFSFPKERIAISLLFWFCLTALAILETENRPRSHSVTWRMAHTLGIVVMALSLTIGIRALLFDTHYAKAQKHAERNDWTQVVRESTAAIKQGVFDPQIYLLRGIAHSYLGNYAQAATDNQKCLKLHPHFLNGLNNMGLIYNTLKQYQNAHDTLQHALDIKPNHADALANLGVSYQGLQQFDKSVTAFESAFHIEPANPNIRAYLSKAYYSQGEFHLGQGDPNKAIKAYENFLKIWQGDAQSTLTVQQKLRALQNTP